MGLWSSIKGALTKSPLDEARDQRRAEREAEKAEPVPDDVPEMPQDVPTPTPSPASPAETAPAAEKSEPDYRTYTVRSGDTLSQIGVDHGVDWHDIAELNDLENPDLIYPGQVFKIPNE
ncbi:MAG TPA: LysM peptidoglycan-binding domain-containing protein [Aeromicrobium sp.]|nr:LysM peptidoglycan-binding domain-containing protein [Aeromicrobium sp.]